MMRSERLLFLGDQRPFSQSTQPMDFCYSSTQPKQNHLGSLSSLLTDFSNITLGTQDKNFDNLPLPISLQIVVNKALAACTENIARDRSMNRQSIMALSQLQSLALGTSVKHQQPNIGSISPRPHSPDSGLGSDNNCNDRGEKRNQRLSLPRPLVRQKEKYVPLSIETCNLSEPFYETNPTSSTNKPMKVHTRQQGPRKQDAIYNARYKTQPCLHFQKYKRCPLGENCHFAHGPDELKHPQAHPKYRTRICINYAKTGNCPFGKNCYFLHYDTKTGSTIHQCSNTKYIMDSLGQSSMFK